MDSAFKGFEKMLEEDQKGIKPLFRSRNWKKDEREDIKRNKRINWYKNDEIEYKSVLFVPPTPGGVLAKQMKAREGEINRNNKERIKIVEKSGQKLENILSKKDPFKKEKCAVKSCPICENQNRKMDILCNTNNIGYRWQCDTCKARDKTKIYEGESSRSARLRGLEHLSSYKNKNSDSVLYKHKILEHAHEDVNFSMEITGVFKDALTRQSDEAVRIYARKNEELLNSKSEFNHPPVARIVVQNTKRKFDKQVSPGV